MSDVVISSAVRTAIGSYGKSLKGVPPSELGATCVAESLKRADLEGENVDQVVFGNVIHTETRDMYMARVVGVNSGIPKEVPALTVNRLCGTGLQALISGAQAIATGDAGIVVTGGAESMSRGPYWDPKARWGARMGDTAIIDPVVGGLTDPFGNGHMALTAENLSESHSISREAQDEFSVESHRRAAKAQEEGLFDDEIVPIEIKVKRETQEFTRDEHIRPDASIEKMAKLRPVFKKDGTVTAGNASGMNDAASAVVLMSKDKADELGAPVKARIIDYAYCGVDPKIMGIGPVPAVKEVLSRSGVALDEIEVIELNEAFAAQALAVIHDLELSPEKVNPNGGAVALGHPVSATGAILVTKIISEMERNDYKLGLVTLCIGGGQGIAVLLGRD